MPTNALQPSTIVDAARPPGWFVRARSLILTIYWGTMALCVASIFIFMFVGVIGYRDWGNYTLAGNPWEPSHFPVYVIWPMRLMSIIAVMAVVGVGFAVADALVLMVIRRSGASAGVGLRLIAAVITLLLEMALAAWLMRWI